MYVDVIGEYSASLPPFGLLLSAESDSDTIPVPFSHMAAVYNHFQQLPIESAIKAT